MSDQVTVSKGITVDTETSNGNDYVVVHASESRGAYCDYSALLYVPVADQLAFAKAVVPAGYEVVEKPNDTGPCSVCGAVRKLMQNGCVRKHNGAEKVGGWRQVCAGSYKRPAVSA